ncbi:hypothetical protein V8G54_010405 [Vigna mungo]|uniref:Uncharacterized protein n=1 Tax=Vigna mungo TaxID=3915 RepID=A0AAQ3P006_VIGMU
MEFRNLGDQAFKSSDILIHAPCLIQCCQLIINTPFPHSSVTFKQLLLQIIPRQHLIIIYQRIEKVDCPSFHTQMSQVYFYHLAGLLNLEVNLRSRNPSCRIITIERW